MRYVGSMSTMKPYMSSFGDIITAKRSSQIVGNFLFGVKEDTLNDQLTGSASVYIDGNAGFENLLTLSTGIAASSTGMLESKNALRYIPGFELGLFFSAVFVKPTVDGYAKVGFMDEYNGFWIGFKEVDGTIEFGVAIRKDGVETFVKQSDFNGDILDGNGCRRFDLGPEKGNVYRIRAGYLGFAPPTFEVMTPNGELIIMHQFEYPNSQYVTHISNTYLSVRGEVSNGSATEDVAIKTGSVNGYIVDGDSLKVNARDFSLGVNNTTSSGAAYNRYPLIAFKNSGSFQGYLSPTVKNHKISALLNYFALYLGGQNKTVRLELIIIDEDNITNTPTWESISSDSILNYSTNANFDDSNAKVLYTTVCKKTEDKIEPSIIDSKLMLKPHQVAIFAITSTTTLAIEWDFANGWSELF